MKRDMTKGSEWRCILFFALPIMLGQLLQQLYSTVDGIIVGNYVSQKALAAVGACTSLAFVFIAIAMGMSGGCSIVISQLYGAKKMDELKKTEVTTIWLLLGLGIAVTAVCLIFSKAMIYSILKIGDSEIAQQARIYIIIYSLGLTAQFLYNAIAAILRALGDSKAVLYFLLVSTIANIILDLLFVAGFRMGVFGAAFATVLAQIACTVVSFIYMFRRFPELRIARNELSPDMGKLKVCVKMGIPTTIQQLIVSCGHVTLQRLINSFGENTMAACTIGSRYEHYVSVPAISFLQAEAAFSGQNAGAGRYDRVKRGLFSAIIMDVIIVVILSVILFAFASPLSALFGVDGIALSQAIEYIRFVCLFYFLFAIYIPLNGCFQGCGIPIAGTICSFLALGSRIIISYTMAGSLNMGYSACWKSCPWGWALALLFATVVFLSGKWKKGSVMGRTK
ncbi:MAG: MATE family efflux transporter [Oscillospiraceae bacterium]|nr:MATE family efflux transporter [Oscillospiraceae bacterium]